MKFQASISLSKVIIVKSMLQVVLPGEMVILISGRIWWIAVSEVPKAKITYTEEVPGQSMF